MFKRLFGQILLHLGDLEDEFRLFHLRDDIAMFIITAVCMLLANVIMLRVDFILYQASMDLFYLMIPFRSIQILLSGFFLFMVRRTKQVQKFDLLVFSIKTDPRPEHQSVSWVFVCGLSLQVRRACLYCGLNHRGAHLRSHAGTGICIADPIL